MQPTATRDDSVPGLTIRRAEARDVESFLDLVDALADYERLDRPTPEARERLGRDGFGDHPRYNPYIAELSGEPVAYAITFFTYSSFLARPTLYLEDVFVIPGARRAGIGHAMIRHLAAEALRLECGRMEWVVLDWNTPAIDFYEKIGARRLAEWYSYRLSAEDLARLAE